MENDNRTVLYVLIGVFALFALFAGFGAGGYGMMGYGMGFGFLFMLLFLGAAVWLVVTIIDSGNAGRKGTKDPAAILKRRYASGEITKAQYEEMKKELTR